MNNRQKENNSKHAVKYMSNSKKAKKRTRKEKQMEKYLNPVYCLVGMDSCRRYNISCA
jgi:transposase